MGKSGRGKARPWGRRSTVCSIGLALERDLWCKVARNLGAGGSLRKRWLGHWDRLTLSNRHAEGNNGGGSRYFCLKTCPYGISGPA